MQFKKVTILTGHYGSGKTNIAVNLAMHLRRLGGRPAIVDLDIVNPYFRTADFGALFRENDIRLVASAYANSNLDIPSLSIDLRGVIDTSSHVIIDVGGDDAGAVALGRYSGLLREADMLFVFNKYRYLTRSAAEALDFLRAIEAASRIRCTGIINNSCLGGETTAEDVAASLPYAEELAGLAGLPLCFTAAKKELAVPDTFPVEIFVRLDY